MKTVVILFALVVSVKSFELQNYVGNWTALMHFTDQNYAEDFKNHPLPINCEKFVFTKVPWNDDNCLCKTEQGRDNDLETREDKGSAWIFRPLYNSPRFNLASVVIAVESFAEVAQYLEHYSCTCNGRYIPHVVFQKMKDEDYFIMYKQKIFWNMKRGYITLFARTPSSNIKEYANGIKEFETKPAKLVCDSDACGGGLFCGNMMVTGTHAPPHLARWG